MPVAGHRSLQFKFTGVAAGHYAFSVFQDVDEDGDLNTNLLTMPTEPYGFSNNANCITARATAMKMPRLRRWNGWSATANGSPKTVWRGRIWAAVIP